MCTSLPVLSVVLQQLYFRHQGIDALHSMLCILGIGSWTSTVTWGHLFVDIHLAEVGLPNPKKSYVSAAKLQESSEPAQRFDIGRRKPKEMHIVRHELIARL